MDLVRAKEIIQMLADGIDPVTGEVLPQNNTYNSPEVIRALFTVLNALQETLQDPLRNAGKPWTEVEDNKLRDEFDAKIKIAEIAKEHGRSYTAIESRLAHLGLKKKPFWLFGRK